MYKEGVSIFTKVVTLSEAWREGSQFNQEIKSQVIDNPVR